MITSGVGTGNNSLRVKRTVQFPRKKMKEKKRKKGRASGDRSVFVCAEVIPYRLAVGHVLGEFQLYGLFGGEGVLKRRNIRPLKAVFD